MKKAKVGALSLADSVKRERAVSRFFSCVCNSFYPELSNLSKLPSAFPPLPLSSAAMVVPHHGHPPPWLSLTYLRFFTIVFLILLILPCLIMFVFLIPCSNGQQHQWRDRGGFRILLVPMTWWCLSHGIGVRGDQRRGIGGHVYLSVLAW